MKKRGRRNLHNIMNLGFGLVFENTIKIFLLTLWTYVCTFILAKVN